MPVILSLRTHTHKRRKIDPSYDILKFDNMRMIVSLSQSFSDCERYKAGKGRIPHGGYRNLSLFLSPLHLNACVRKRIANEAIT